MKLLSFEEQQTIPEFRAAGVFAAGAPLVAVIEDHCRVTPEWAEAALEAHEQGHAVVGGPIRNVVTERARDWAALSASTAPSWSRCPRGRRTR